MRKSIQENCQRRGRRETTPIATWGGGKSTPQKPTKRAYEQSPNTVQHWLDDDYIEIKSRDKAKKAEIYRVDETGMRNDSQHGRGFTGLDATGSGLFLEASFRIKAIDNFHTDFRCFIEQRKISGVADQL